MSKDKGGKITFKEPPLIRGWGCALFSQKSAIWWEEETKRGKSSGWEKHKKMSSILLLVWLSQNGCSFVPHSWDTHTALHCVYLKKKKSRKLLEESSKDIFGLGVRFDWLWARLVSGGSVATTALPPSSWRQPERLCFLSLPSVSCLPASQEGF